MTTFSAASDENFIKMTTFPFQWMGINLTSDLRKQHQTTWLWSIQELVDVNSNSKYCEITRIEENLLESQLIKRIQRNGIDGVIIGSCVHWVAGCGCITGTEQKTNNRAHQASWVRDRGILHDYPDDAQVTFYWYITCYATIKCLA